MAFLFALITFFFKVITVCEKPNFFLRGRPFRVLDVANNKLYWDRITKFKRGEVYVGGSLSEFMEVS